MDRNYDIGNRFAEAIERMMRNNTATSEYTTTTTNGNYDGYYYRPRYNFDGFQTRRTLERPFSSERIYSRPLQRELIKEDYVESEQISEFLGGFKIKEAS